jgi:hypothetical protein
MSDVFCKASGHSEKEDMGICTLENITLNSNGSCEQYREKPIYSKGRLDVSIRNSEVYDNHFGILLFFYNKIDVDYVFNILQKWHGFNIAVDFVDVNLMLGPAADSDIIDKIAKMVVHCQYQEYYIIPEQRTLRQALKKLLEEKTSQVLKHFKLYKKVVEAVNKRSVWK